MAGGSGRKRAGKKAAEDEIIVARVPRVEGADEGGNEDRSESELAADEVVDNAAESMPAVAEAMVFRADHTGKEAYLDKVSAEVISPEWLANEYGGGKYRVQFRVPDGKTNRMVYAKQKRFEVDPSIPSKPPRHARVAATAPVQNADGSPAGSSSFDAVLSGGLLQMFNAMQQSSQVQIEAMRAMATQKQGPGMLEIITALTPLVALVIPLLTPKSDPMETAQKIAALIKGGGESSAAAPATAVRDMFSMMKDVVELQQSLGIGTGEGSQPDPMLKMIETLAPKILEILSGAQRHDAAAAAGAVPRVEGAPQIPPAAAGSPAQSAPVQTPATEGSPMWRLFVGPRVPRLIEMAKRGKRPELYAELEEDNIPEAFKGAAREFFARDDYSALIFNEYPQLREYETWFMDFFEALRDFLLGIEDADELDDAALEDAADETRIDAALDQHKGAGESGGDATEQ